MTNSQRPIRQAKTRRGQDVMRQVLSSARSLLEERYLNDISILELAEEAGVVRASLLLQFRNGWPDIACTLAYQALFGPFDRMVVDMLESDMENNLSKNAAKPLETFIDLAEKTGLLVPNLRAQMFVWGDENYLLFSLPGQDFNEQFAELLADGAENVSDDHRYAAEVLINLALDMAGGVGLYGWTADERRDLLRRHVEIVLDGLAD